MKIWLWLLAFLLSLLQSTFLNLNLLLLLIIIFALLSKEKEVFYLAFFSGLLFDFFSLNLLGRTSLSLLGVVAFIFLYKLRFSANHLIFWFLTVFITANLFALVNLGRFDFVESSLLAGFSLVIYLILKRQGSLSEGDQLKLKI